MNKEKPTQDYEVPEPLASNDELPSTATVAAKAPSEAVVTQPTNTDEKISTETRARGTSARGRERDCMSCECDESSRHVYCGVLAFIACLLFGPFGLCIAVLILRSSQTPENSDSDSESGSDSENILPN